MKYRTILIDPPWPYHQKLESAKTRGGVKYDTMSLADLAALPVGDWADTDCQLWLWSTNSHLHQAFHLVEAWGFEYKTIVTWAKTQIGLGYWLRGQTEHVLLAIRGNPRRNLAGEHGATGKGWSTLITDKRGEHSEKPQVFIDMVEEMGEAPRLEVFCRRQRLGWAALGFGVGTSLQTGGKRII